MINNLANSFGAMPMFGLSLGLFTLGTILFIALIVCVTILKGYVLWTAAKRDEVGWFVALLLINTFGILELIYLYFVVGKWKKNH